MVQGSRGTAQWTKLGSHPRGPQRLQSRKVQQQRSRQRRRRLYNLHLQEVLKQGLCLRHLMCSDRSGRPDGHHSSQQGHHHRQAPHKPPMRASLLQLEGSSSWPAEMGWAKVTLRECLKPLGSGIQCRRQPQQGQHGAAGAADAFINRIIFVPPLGVGTAAAAQPQQQQQQQWPGKGKGEKERRSFPFGLKEHEWQAVQGLTM